MSATDVRGEPDATGGHVVVSRDLPVAPEVALTAWSDPALLRRWWGPDGFTCPRAEVDLRVGGSTLVTVRAPAEWGGFEIHNSWRHTFIARPRRIEFVSTFVDAAGAPVEPATAGVPATVPAEVPHVVELVALPDGGTRVTVTESGYADEETRAQSQLGQEQCFDKMQALFGLNR